MSFTVHTGDALILAAADAVIDGRRVPKDPNWRKRPRISAKRRRLGFWKGRR